VQARVVLILGIIGSTPLPKLAVERIRKTSGGAVLLNAAEPVALVAKPNRKTAARRTVTIFLIFSDMATSLKTEIQERVERAVNQECG